MQSYKNHPIFGLALPTREKLWRSIGMVFDPERPAQEIKRLECAEIVSTTSDEAEEIALTLCKAWIDGLGPKRNTTH